MSATSNQTTDNRRGGERAVLYRMVTPEHTCPYGIKAKHLLESQGYAVEDHWLTTREATEAFKSEYGVRTTPQTFINGQRIGGYDDLRRHVGKAVADPAATSYKPVIAVFTMTALMALAASQAVFGTPLTVQAGAWFIGFSMCVLALLKLQDIESFSSMFLGYDLLAKRWVPYAYLYPFAEGLAGVLMVAGVLTWLSVPIALVIGTIGAVSVFKAVYVDKRDIKCACVGGATKVPLGFVSLTENVMMIAMAVWMGVAAVGLGAGNVHGQAMHRAPAAIVLNSTASTAAFQAVHHQMMGAMDIAYTGDADIDFVRAMIPHHEGAIAMAKVVQRSGHDPEIRRLADNVVAAQDGEIRQMQVWLVRHGQASLYSDLSRTADAKAGK